MSAGESDGLVLLRTCGDVHEAYVIRSVLDAGGIDVFIPDEFMSPLHPAPVFSAGGVRIMVREHDVERAREILESEPGEASEADQALGYRQHQDAEQRPEQEPDGDVGPGQERDPGPDSNA